MGCGVGLWFDENTDDCENVGAGYYSGDDDNNQYACAVNHYGTSGVNTYTTSFCAGECPTNSSSPEGSDNIDDCDGNCGYYSCADGTCNVAGAGYYSLNNNDTRSVCAANYYGSSTTNCTSSCNGACPTNSTSPAGSDKDSLRDSNRPEPSYTRPPA